MNWLKVKAGFVSISNDAVASPVTSDTYSLGETCDRKTSFELSDEQLSHHSFVIGSTGSGKSKFLELLMRYFIVSRKGFALIDPHGDLSEDLLAYAGYRKLAKQDADIASRIHYLEPSYEQVFSFDPFRFSPSRPIPEELIGNARIAWLRAKADRIAEVFQRKQNQSGFEGMPRLQRILTDVLVAVGTAVDADGRHVPLSDALVLLDVGHKRHREVFDRVRPHLEAEILADFERLKRYPNDEQRLRETESTINRLRSLLSPIVKAIFSDQVESIDLRSIIQNGEILLINLRETDYFSADQQSAIGGVFIQELLSIARNEARESRKLFHVLIDEAGNFVGEDIKEALGVMRKFRTSICLAAQDLSSFRKGELDLRPKVLSQCHTKICFQQAWPDDLEILARVLATGNLSFQKHYQDVDRPDGYDWIDVEERSENSSTSQSQSTTNSFTTSQTQGTSDATNSSCSTNQSSSSGGLRGNASSSTSGSASMSGKTHTSSHSTTEGEGRSDTSGSSETHGESISYKKVPLARNREERIETPHLQNSISDQLERIRSILHGLTMGQAVAKVKDRTEAVLFATQHVDEKWLLDDKQAAIERMKSLCRQKPYFVVPDFSPAAAEARLAEFASPESKVEPNLEEPRPQKTPFL